MSNMHISDELPRLLNGEASRDVVLAAAEHLRSCPDCQQELVSAVVAHAALTSAQRFAPEIVAGHSMTDDAGDPATDDAAARTPRPQDAEQPTPPLPSMSSMFEKVRSEAAQAQRAAARRPVRRRLIAVAAAAAVIAGGGVAIVEATGPSSTQQASRSVVLYPFDTGHTKATIRVVGNRTLQVNASDLPRLDAQHSYELWLTNGSRTEMQPVGFIGTNNTADLTVSPQVMAQYTNFEVSVQQTDQRQYSGVSVLRGAYRA